MTEESVQLLTEKADDFVAAVENHDRFEKWNQANDERKGLENERFRLQKDWAPFVRFMRAHNNVVLAENLGRSGSEKNRSRYTRLRESEKGALGSLLSAE